MDLNALRRLAGISTPDIKVVSPDSPANDFRRMAGLPALPVAEAPKEDLDDMDAKTADEEPTEEMPGDELPSIVSSIAAEAEGKSGEELAQLIKQVYDAGVADGKSQAEEPTEEEPTDGEPEVKEDEEVEEEAKKAISSDTKSVDTCPSCSSADVKMHSDGEKECNECHKTWDVQGVKEDSEQAPPTVRFDLIKQAALSSK